MRNAENNQRVKCGKFSPEYSAFYQLCQLVVVSPPGINFPWSVRRLQCAIVFRVVSPPRVK